MAVTGDMVAAEEVINASTDMATDFAMKIGSLGKWLQAIGIIVVLWILIQIINWYINSKRIKKLEKIEERLEAIEKKLNKAVKSHK
ncbi:MAG: hypothetical protein ABIH92_00590 [Nanoarchaeota archaeon]